MIERWFETFFLLEKASVQDGMGGEHISYAPVMTFQGVLTLSTEKEADMAGQTISVQALMLLHEFDVTLSPGEYVRREQDSTVYRVIGRSGDRCAPAFSGLRFAQVKVERVVHPC